MQTTTVNSPRFTIRFNDEKLKRISRLMKTIGHPSRLKIVDLLIEKGKMSVGEIAETLELKQSNTSQHLKALEDINALYSAREGTSVYYDIATDSLKKLLGCVNECISC